jgi:hypothetical protein
MPTLDLFEPKSDAVVRESLQRARMNARRAIGAEYETAIDYAEGRMRDDVVQHLSRRYEATQQGRMGQQIAPVTVPLAERYLDDAATLYSGKVTRKIVDENGEENEQLTAQYNKLLQESEFDDVMHQAERHSYMVHTVGLWPQARRGSVRMVEVLPHSIEPIAAGGDFFDVTDQEDYDAFVVELDSPDGSMSAAKRSYAYISRPSTLFYEASDPWSLSSMGNVREFENPYLWPQVADTDDGRGTGLRLLPIMPFALIHRIRPCGELLIESDPTMMLVNRELNLQLSLLMDTLAHQGWATPVIRTANPDDAPPTFAAGPRFGVSLGIDESMDLLSSTQSYADLVGVLESFVKLEAVMHGRSPNDFSLSGNAPQSGFAKAVDSIPKLEKREKAAERFSRIEETVLYPRIAAVGARIGKLPAPEVMARHRLQVKFEDVEFMRTVDERIREEEHDLKHGFRSPAEILAARDGIDVESAQARIDENKGRVPSPEQPQQPQEEPTERPRRTGDLLGQLMTARRNGGDNGTA